ncbi:LiaG family protein [Mesobacillus subterraneus]|uniref:DUF4097 domain-containing protein n=1 Tax=Mesobacillus subterraneus TaxID=285983 RepID=A0A427TQS2_9BACI|nr:DUF4097 family beta strand repeat-containing protein [Mesobacillus subterraneus]RSD26621.1 DUF4097 domain-containing protein [Mesobacillus subterraneus]
MMKRILIIFLVITGAYLVLNYLVEGGFGINLAKGQDSARVTDRTETISIDISSVKTEIVPEDRDDVRAELKGKGTVKVTTHGDEIHVSAKRKGFFWFNWFELDQTSLIVYIPENFKEEMAIRLGSGDAVFKGPSANEPMELKKLALDIGSGSMVLKNIDADILEHHSSSGDVQMDAITAGSGTFKVSSGSVNVQNYAGQLDANVSSGELEIQMNELKDSINLNVSSGDIELDLPDDADFTLKGKMSSGDVTSRFPLENKEETKNHLRGKHGSGKYEINADVSSGEIEIF